MARMRTRNAPGRSIGVASRRISEATPERCDHLEYAVQRALLRRLGQRIQTLRAETRISRDELAQRCGLNPEVLDLIECGSYDVSLLELVSLGEALGTGLADLFKQGR